MVPLEVLELGERRVVGNGRFLATNDVKFWEYYIDTQNCSFVFGLKYKAHIYICHKNIFHFVHLHS